MEFPVVLAEDEVGDDGAPELADAGGTDHTRGISWREAEEDFECGVLVQLRHRERR